MVLLYLPASVQREGLLRQRDADLEVRQSGRPGLAPEDRPPDRVSGRGQPPTQASTFVCMCVCPSVCVFVPQVVHQPNDRERLLQRLHQPDQ